ncbi:cation:proton antiporter domain-containing protein [Cupriavidus basilensis]
MVHVSAPLSVVIMGLVIGNHSATKSMSEKTREHLFNFWGLLDELLNLVLFGLIGLEIIALSLQMHIVWLGLAAIPVGAAGAGHQRGHPAAGAAELPPAQSALGHHHDLGAACAAASRSALALSLPEFPGRADADRRDLPGGGVQPADPGHHARQAGQAPEWPEREAIAARRAAERIRRAHLPYRRLW